MTKYKWGIVGALAVAAFAIAGPIKVWGPGETLTSTDLNANFQHIHNLMVGGHGPRLVNADVSANAGISHSKLATPALLPKMWTIVANCTVTPCTMSEGSGVSSVSRTTTGTYVVNYTSRVNATAAPILTSTGASAFKTCSVTAYGQTSVGVGCIEHRQDGGVPILSDDGFTFLLMDVDN